MKKISVSFIVALAFMLMFSVQALAALSGAVGSPKATVMSSTSVKLTWTAPTAVTPAIDGYKIYQSGTTTLLATIPAGTLEHTFSGLTPNDVVRYDIVAYNAEGNSSKATVAAVPKGDLESENADMDSTDADNPLQNANQSGNTTAGSANTAASTIKSGGMTNADGTTGTQRTHGEYHNNTNSCASCHQTHTAASKGLLFKDGVYATCAACHDGTLGFYNVFENGNHKNSAGTFGGDVAGNMSVHLATGAVTMAAAPGGYNQEDRGGKWTAEFNCASCHSPHGSYSDRLLHYNPNNMGSTKPADGGIKAGGYKSGETAPVLNYASDKNYPAAGSAKYIGVRGSKTDFGITDTKVGASDVVVMIFEKQGDTSTYEKTTNPFIYGYPTRGSGTNNHYYYTRLFLKDPTTSGFLNTNGTYPAANAEDVIDHYDYLNYEKETDASKKAYIYYQKGYIFGPDNGVVELATHVEISRSYVTKLDLMPINADGAGKPDGTVADGWWDFGGVKITTVNQRALYTGEVNPDSTNVFTKWGVAAGAKVPGWGIAMSGYCSSCHVDYLASTSNQTATNGGEGIFTKGYRHTTKSDSYTCVRCHFAHGTDVQIMLDAQNRTVADAATDLFAGDTVKATAYMLDKNTSSALKRYTNMAVCWSCHTSSRAEQLKNNTSYSHKTDGSEDPRGIPGLEGTLNWPTPIKPALALPGTVVGNDQTDTITGLANGMEYSVDGGATWRLQQAGGGTPKFPGVVTVQVRYAAVEGVTTAGPVTTINNFTIHTPPAPSVTANDATNSITGATTAMEYSIDGGAWTTWSAASNGTFTGTMSVDVRVKAVAGVNLDGTVKNITFTP